MNNDIHDKFENIYNSKITEKEITDFINIYNKKLGLYFGDAGDVVKKELRNVNINWSKLNVVITTSTTGAGIDYNIKNHFFYIYLRYILLTNNNLLINYLK